MGRRSTLYIALVIFGVYTVWMIGPYLQSIIVRDASVTAWSRFAVAPIDGQIATELPKAGSIVGEDGVVALIRNTLLLEETRAVENTRDAAIAARTRIAEAEEYLADLDKIEAERVAARDKSAEVFHQQLETEIENLGREIEVNAERVAVLERIAERQRALVDRGAGSDATLDEALLRLSALKARQAELDSELNFARLRDSSAEQGVFINADGGTPDWLRYGELEVRLERRRTQHELHEAEAALEEAERDLASEEKTLAELREAQVKAPPGSVIFSILAAPGATVAAGERIIEWIDCGDMMVDVPVSDAELPLVRAGSPAEVVLEGEPDVRSATVMTTRGATATLGRSDLSAVAKGREPGVAQVLLQLEAEPGEFEHCPIGRAAYVEFPEVGLIDVLRARLRL